MPNCPLTLRLVKGSKLTFSELDQNFLSLNACINSVNSNFVNYLPLSGGTLTGPLSACTGISTDNLYPCSDTLTIWGNLVVQGSATTINTEIIKSQDNNIVLNYSGTHLTAIGGGITVEDGQSNGVDSRIYTDTNGYWVFDPGLSATTGTINSLSACTGIWTSNLHGCSPIKVWDNLTLSGSVIDSQGGGYLDLRYGNNDGRFYLGNDNGGYSDTFIQGENGYLEISAYDPAARIAMFTDGGNAGFVLTNDTSLFSTDINLYTDTTSIVSTPNNYIGLGSGNSLEITNDNVWIKGNEAFNITTNPHSGVGLGVSSDLLIATVTGTSYTTNTLRETNPSILSSQYSTIQMGIKNSVILGGYNLNATQDNTAYVDNLNIKTVGSGTSVINLGLDSNGNVVTGVTTIDTNTFTTGVTLNGTTLEFNRNDLSNAYSVNLSSLQFTGNTSGDCITDLYISNLYGCSPITIHDDIILETGTTISTKNGGGQLELDRLSIGSNVLLSVDNGSASDAFLNLQPGQANLASLLGDVYILSNTFTRMITGGLFNPHSEVLMEPESFKLGIKDSTAPYINDIESVVVYNTHLSGQSTSIASKWPTLVSSKNSTVSTGVLNSVILGGQNITATTNNTAYVDNLNIKTLGGGTSVVNLGLDSNGFVVTGTSGSLLYTQTNNYTLGVPITINHNLNTTDVLVQIIDTNTSQLIYGSVDNYQLNALDVTLNTSLNNVKVLVIGSPVSQIVPKGSIVYVLAHDSISPTDNTNYFIGQNFNLTPSTSSNDSRRFIAQKSGTITQLTIKRSITGVLGSNEINTFYINNVTQSTQSLVTSSETFNSSASLNNYTLSSPLNVTAGDKIEIQWLTPVWGTNPTSVRQTFNMLIEY